jgi:3-carboxy-cis,cis-muconate cycloisomerase
MPQKRNPVDATLALASARLALGQVPVLLGAVVQEHERAAGAWQAEWQALPRLVCATGATLAYLHGALAGLEIDERRMARNLSGPHGLVMAEALTLALAGQLGRPAAFRLVQQACRRAVEENSDLRSAVLDDERLRAALPEAELDRVLDPRHYLGSTERFVDRALADFRSALPSD